MELRVPLVVVQSARRLVHAWVPTLDGVAATGPSLSEMRDDLRLAVMERFAVDEADALGRYQIAPHAWLEAVRVEVVFVAPKTRQRHELEATVSVLVEKWPADSFHVVTPTRLPVGRFALRNPAQLQEALQARLAAWALDHEWTTLEKLHVQRRERLEVLDVDAIAPSIFPALWRIERKKKSTDSAEKPDAAKSPAKPKVKEEETPAQRDERRRLRRLTVRTLRAVARDLTHAAMDDTLPRAFGRDGLVDRLVDTFAAREGVAVVLVGPSGAGKTAVVSEFVHRLTRWCERNATRRDVWRVDGNRFIAGMKYVGQWESRARELITELTETGDIVYLDDLASMVEAGRHAKGDTNVAQFLEPHIGRGELTVIAESTPERLAWAREEAPTFAALFQVVHVDAMTDEQSLPVLLGALRDLESEDETARPVRLSPAVLETLMVLTRRFMPNEAFPGKAVRTLRAMLDGPDAGGARRYTDEDVYAVVQRKTGLPDFILRDGAALPRSEITARLTAQVVGQPEAVSALADLVVSMQHMLCDPDKPLGTYLFVGPTGVGKTESAKALAKLVFGSGDRLVRFDMSEFASGGSVMRLLGHPGEPDGELTSALRLQPFCVILFDEVEKAHPRVFDALLQLLGEGRISDAAGRLADARQAVVILTSNLGVREASSQAGFARGEPDEVRRHYVSSVEKYFRPEFFNRIDRVVAFRPLTREALSVVVRHALGDLLSRRGIARSRVLVDVERDLLDVLVEQAYDPRYGARPIKRALERKLTVPLAHHLLRRQADDLALVELYLRGEEIALSVQSLTVASVVASADPGLADAAAARALLADLGARVEALRESPAVAEMRALREATIAAVTSGAAELPAAVSLLDQLDELAARVEKIELDAVLDDDWFETEDTSSVTSWGRNWSTSSGRHRFRGGLSPKARYDERPVHANERAALAVVGDELRALDDALTVFAARVAAAPAGERAWTILVESVMNPDPEVIRDFAWVAAGDAADVKVWHDQGRSASPRWVSDGPTPSGVPHERSCVAVRGLGLEAWFASLSGYAQAAAGGGLYRIHVWEGGDGLARVEAHDVDRAAEVAARRRGEAVRVTAPPRITLRTEPDYNDEQRYFHCATGMDVRKRAAILARLLRDGV